MGFTSGIQSNLHRKDDRKCSDGDHLVDVRVQNTKN